MDLNRACLIGNVTKDPELKTTPSGQSVISFSIATNFIWKDQAGNKQEKAEFHNIVAWRKLAETMGQYLKKGGKVYVEGRLQTRTWEDKDGKKNYRTEIVADNIILLNRPQGGTSTFNPSEPSSSHTEEYSQPETKTAKEEEINIEDIPF